MKTLETNTAYHGNKSAIGSSLVKKIHSKTLLHALTEEVNQTDSMVLGSGIHCAILEPERFASEFVVAPKCDRRTKEGKETFAAFELASVGKTILSFDQMEMIQEMKEALLAHPLASHMLSGGEAEYSYYAKDPMTGVDLKCRPDYHKSGSLIDLKTTVDASFEGFARQAGNLGYHIQAAFYLDVFNLSQGTDYKDFYFVAIENKAPHAIAIYHMDQTHIEHGRAAYRKALQKYAEFKASGVNLDDIKALRSFGYSPEIIDLQIPFYILDKIQIA